MEGLLTFNHSEPVDNESEMDWAGADWGVTTTKEPKTDSERIGWGWMGRAPAARDEKRKIAGVPAP